jgi:signal transduction histidine kinase
VATPDVTTALRRRPKSFILACTACVLIAVGALQTTHLWVARQRMLSSATSRIVNMTSVLAEYVRGSFAIADTALTQLTIHGRRVGGSHGPAEAWNPMLAAARASLIGTGSISVSDQHGVIRHSTVPALVGQSRRDQYLHKQLAAVGRDELVVDTPFLTLFTPRRYVIPLGRRLTTPEGAFDGMVVATLPPDGYREFFRTVELGFDSVIWVFHPDGVVLFREPSDTNPINQPAGGNPVLQAARRSGGSGTIEGTLDSDGPRFISAYHTVVQPPVIVAISMNRDALLAEWHRELRFSAFVFGLLILTLAAVVLILSRQIDARAIAERELDDAQRQEAVRLSEANERLEAALDREQRARQEIEEASRLKDEFLMTVSHELRTPLTAIYGWVRMLSSNLVPPQQRGNALTAIERNARAQMRLIDDLLDVSQAITGKVRLEVHPVNPVDIVRNAIATVRPALEAKTLHLTTALSPHTGTILADPDRVQQIVWNLLSNAIKFTPEGGSIDVRVERVSDHAEFIVRDSGVGIDPAFVPFVFDRFRQGESGPSRRFGGLGLGLAIVRHLVELHGGTVSAESVGEGRGATFRVVLPARPRTAPGGA